MIFKYFSFSRISVLVILVILFFMVVCNYVLSVSKSRLPRRPTGMISFVRVPFPSETSTTCPVKKIRFMDTTMESRVALLSFPGSGNTWTRHLIQQLTGFATGSVYCARSLNNSDFPGECVSVRSKTKRCIVYKSHKYDKVSMAPFQRAIILIRNPFDSMKTWFNFRFGKTRSDSFIDNTTIAKDKRRTRRRPVVESKKEHGDPFHAHVHVSQYKSDRWNGHITGEFRYWYSSVIFWLQTFQDRSLLVRYEDLKTDLIPTLKRVSNFLNIEPSKEDYKCTYLNQEGHYRRTQAQVLQVPDIYSDRQIDIINGAIWKVINATNNSQQKASFKKYLYL